MIFVYTRFFVYDIAITKFKREIMAIIKSKLFLFVVIVGSFAIVGQIDYNDRMMEYHQYCEDVDHGLYPDYKHMIKKCRKLI